ncbi:hypothetical protein [Streptomyces sp. NPDC004376]
MISTDGPTGLLTAGLREDFATSDSRNTHARTVVRSREVHRLVGLGKASAVTGIVCYLLGCLQVVLTIPAHACPDRLELHPPVHLLRYDSGVLPPRVTCHWDDGTHKDFVSGWINPLTLVCAVVLAACLVRALVLFRRRRTGRAG